MSAAATSPWSNASTTSDTHRTSLLRIVLGGSVHLPAPAYVHAVPLTNGMTVASPRSAAAPVLATSRTAARTPDAHRLIPLSTAFVMRAALQSARRKRTIPCPSANHKLASGPSTPCETPTVEPNGIGGKLM